MDLFPVYRITDIVSQFKGWEYGTITRCVTRYTLLEMLANDVSGLHFLLDSIYCFFYNAMFFYNILGSICW